MTITVIYDNRCEKPALQEGWGFSVLVDFEGRKILFDTGGYPKAFFSNIDKLGIRLDEVTHLLFSHRHWDHMAGFDEVLSKLRRGTQVILPRFFWRSPFKHRHLQFKTVKSFSEIDRNIFSISLKGGRMLYEQSLVLKTAQGTAIITGCAHPGIVNIIRATQEKLPGNVSFVMGGFHLLFTPGHVSAGIVEDFKELGVQKVAPCHCSGDHTIRQFQEAYTDRFFKIGTGSVIPLGS
ncbi:MAG: MBL fold metallo-hydrolase [Parachlamydia sp.]|nr:MBL fold metallo-hydrolase [Parachlamydia sp.]